MEVPSCILDFCLLFRTLKHILPTIHFSVFLPATDVVSMGTRSCKLTKQHGARLARLETRNNSKSRQFQTQHVALPFLGLETTSNGCTMAGVLCATEQQIASPQVVAKRLFPALVFFRCGRIISLFSHSGKKERPPFSYDLQLKGSSAFLFRNRGHPACQT